MSSFKQGVIIAVALSAAPCAVGFLLGVLIEWWLLK